MDTPGRRQRSSVACRRCRRMRIKCIHDASNTPPCNACRTAGAQDCAFPRRGEAGTDREWRSRPRSPSRTDPISPRMSFHERSRRNSSAENDSNQSSLPTHGEVLEACRVFTTSYFQLGFIPKTDFFERVSKDDVSEFLLLCILSLSARFTPCLISRYRDGAAATEFFTFKALEKIPREMYSPTLENIQAFFLLSIAEWGNGDRDRSAIHMGIAVRMAAMMKLHREETYHLPVNASREQITYAETARRTFWMIQSQDNLHSGHSSPVPFSSDDITALLPCDESDFSFGVIPSERAALPGTPPAKANPSLVDSPRRSLFATLIQTHNLWGKVARKVCRPDQNAPTGLNNDYIDLSESLKRFEDQLPSPQKWSEWSLKVWKDMGLELAYLSVVMMLRLSNILMRRVYLDNIKASISNQSIHTSPSGVLKTVADELFENVVELHEQIDASFAIRSRSQGYPAILVFPVYVCGSLALNLWQCPQLCPPLADKASTMLTRSLQVISDLQQAWPMARRWQQGLQQAATPLSGGPSPASEAHPTTPHALPSRVPRDESLSSATPQRNSQMLLSLEESTEPRSPQRQNDLMFAQNVNIDAIPPDFFDAEVTAFLQGEVHYGLLDEWNHVLLDSG